MLSFNMNLHKTSNASESVVTMNVMHKCISNGICTYSVKLTERR